VTWGQGFRPAAALPGGVLEAQIVGILSDFGQFALSQAEQKLGCTVEKHAQLNWFLRR
jgi:hypothetical protein